MNRGQFRPFLRAPPFPGAKVRSLTQPRSCATDPISEGKVTALLGEIRRLRVGGDYWGAQPALTRGYMLVKVRDLDTRERTIREIGPDQPIVIWSDGDEVTARRPHSSIRCVSAACDPWHLVKGATQVFADADDELGLITAAAGVPMTIVSTRHDEEQSTARALLRSQVIDPFDYVDPFTNEPFDVLQAVRLCGFWRRLIDSNRDIEAAVGFAFWKRATVAPLLWDGSGAVPFVSRAKQVHHPQTVAIWRARTPPAVLSAIERSGATLIEVEDGFIRSAGLGADCVPPLSIVVDRLGIHFDPSTASELELLIESGEFPETLLERARRLRELIILSGVSKYGTGFGHSRRRCEDRLHVLVPGQVEDDRAVLCGGGSLSNNLDLLRRVRARVPAAYILFKPHPDVEAGHRRGAIADEDCREFADEVVRDEPIHALIDMVDEVHVISSLAGFEALLKKKPVTTYGVPFYAGWGLTRDLGPVPARRTAKRTLDELVAAVLLAYPRYLDPVTGVPCPAETLIRRISEGADGSRDGAVVQLRRIQGRWKRRLARVAGALR